MTAHAGRAFAPPGGHSRALRITTGAEAAARDRAAIHAGTPSFELMVRAGTAATAIVLRDCSDRLAHGVALFAGSGNNGGDAYIVAAQLARHGIAARVHAATPPRTDDAQRAAALATPLLVHGAPTGDERVVIDGLLGTGHEGPLRGAIWADCARLALARDGGALVYALDVPSGLDVTSGDIADGSVPAHVTICLGTIKRGVLLQRAHAGRVVLADIGLSSFADMPGDGDDAAWRWAHGASLAALVPPMTWQAHKGTRGRVALAGGEAGMAGAVVLAARAALGAGAGVVHAIVDEPSIAPVQSLVPQALAHRWPAAAGLRRADRGAARDDTPHEGTAREGQVTPSVSHPTPSESNATMRYDALGLGPGLGRTRASTLVLQRLLDQHRGLPLVLDADALWLVVDAASALGTDSASMLRHWTRDSAQVLCTPHPGEFARLLGQPLPSGWRDRAALLSEYAARANCTVLLKGTPTLVASPGEEALWVVPHGTPALATGGSGDCLTGIVTALLGQGASARDAAVLGATVHGVAAEIATRNAGGARGVLLDDVLAAMPAAWRDLAAPHAHAPGVLAELAPLG